MRGAEPSLKLKMKIPAWVRHRKLVHGFKKFESEVEDEISPVFF